MTVSAWHCIVLVEERERERERERESKSKWFYLFKSKFTLNNKREAVWRRKLQDEARRSPWQWFMVVLWFWARPLALLLLAVCPHIRSLKSAVRRRTISPCLRTTCPRSVRFVTAIGAIANHSVPVRPSSSSSSSSLPSCAHSQLIESLRTCALLVSLAHQFQRKRHLVLAHTERVSEFSQ